MSTTPFQPALPAEIAPSEQELNYIDESPPALFPENQNSNFGFIHRKVFSDQMAKVAMLMDTLYAEKFVDSSSAYLDEHEIEVGLPPNPYWYFSNSATNEYQGSAQEGQIHTNAQTGDCRGIYLGNIRPVNPVAPGRCSTCLGRCAPVLRSCACDNALQHRGKHYKFQLRCSNQEHSHSRYACADSRI
jgi:hypothetical protein